MTWIDLTRPMDGHLPIYAEAGYADPPFAVHDWCAVEGQGYAVQRLDLGTQTGTHIDAPAHMVAGGATLEALSPSRLIGRYVTFRPGEVLPDRGEAVLLFLNAPDGGEVSRALFDAALALGFPVWVMAGSLRVRGEEPLFLHRALARAGVFLVEDLDAEAARPLPDRGEMIAAPLRLIGTSGAPCRVLARAMAGEGR
ncbi:cyclase family protein [Gemmobacter aquaticus]|nr:cyclase family protein [Gemmobacter aquaticus]